MYGGNVITCVLLCSYYGQLCQCFCNIINVYQELFEDCFRKQYSLIHRLETNKLRNVARLFAVSFRQAAYLPCSRLHHSHQPNFFPDRSSTHSRQNKTPSSCLSSCAWRKKCFCCDKLLLQYGCCPCAGRNSCLHHLETIIVTLNGPAH